jgi:hypothetical protein
MPSTVHSNSVVQPNWQTRRALQALCFMLLVGGLCPRSFAADSCAQNLTPQTVILDHFEAHDATVNDVVEALTLLAEKATKRAYRPNLVIIGDEIGRMKVSLELKQAPLSDAFDRIGSLPGVQVTYRSNQTVIFSMKDS